ncbi:PDR/VanB family oxidoreductase [Pseudomonas typographi]|uniref:Oxidoreductase n=1 Tax=Pseudomonas typographi TaxID=2715964 RepID=A0ABR7Z3R3_9PSED|nr:PDR/VanB family oxidoreductase [Pseudomonas typographi]MBD1552688.1 oxidoreductase [Pseudomonas typographi]MBD1588169.1 oxidoreductase [Pseudomonas typographi]MBD1600140.1 oxidoreductase [Pseudomonas typographi]
MALSEPCSLVLRLHAVEYAAPGVNLYRFASPSGNALPAFEPGAHVDVQLAPGLVRQYSLLWPQPHPSQYLIAVQLAEGGKGGSRRLHYESVVGEHYRLSPPRNHFAVQPGAAPSVLLAGGIGITPLLAMYRQLKGEGRPVELYYWAARAEHWLFQAELQGQPGVQLFATREGAPVPRLADVLPALPADAQLYCCGPQAMVDAFDRLTAARPAERTHRERFSASAEALQPGGGFSAYLQRSGITVNVAPEQTLLQACEAAGVNVAYSCEEGVCGACEVRILAGHVEHRDSVLSPAERKAGNQMLICCSRGLGDGLVLDL